MAPFKIKMPRKSEASEKRVIKLIISVIPFCVTLRNRLPEFLQCKHHWQLNCRSYQFHSRSPVLCNA